MVLVRWLSLRWLPILGTDFLFFFLFSRSRAVLFVVDARCQLIFWVMLISYFGPAGHWTFLGERGLWFPGVDGMIPRP